MLSLPPRHPVGLPSQSELILISLYYILVCIVKDIIHCGSRHISICYLITYICKRESSSTSPQYLHIYVLFRLLHILSDPSRLVVQAAFTLAPRWPIGFPSQSATVLRSHIFNIAGARLWRIIGPRFPVVVIDIFYLHVNFVMSRTVDESVLRPFSDTSSEGASSSYANASHERRYVDILNAGLA